MIVLWWLIVGHAVSDFPLQGDFLARAKNHKAPIPGVPWFPCLIAHAVICAGVVHLVTQSPAIAVMEFLAHGLTDWLKNEGVLGVGERGFVYDQAIHVACKVAWWVLM